MDVFNHNQIKLLELAHEDFKHYFMLPIPALITDKETGTFLDFNDAAKKLFVLEENDKGHREITSFYSDKNERIYVLKCLEAELTESKNSKKGNWEFVHISEVVINDFRKKFKFYFKPYRNENGELLGSLSLVFPTSEILIFNMLEDSISNGIFEIGFDRSIIHSNKKFNDLLKINEFNSKIYVQDFILNEEDYDGILKNLKPFELYDTGPILLKKQDGNYLLASINILPEFNANNQLIKSRGIIKDLIDQEILDNAPIGIYLLTSVKGEDVIIRANKECLRIFDFDNEDASIGFPIRQLFKSYTDLDNFLFKLEEASNKGKMLQDYLIEIFTVKDNRKELLVSSKMFFDKNTKKNIGKIGIIKDVTNDVTYALRSVQQDFADFLHSYANMIISMRDTINSAISGLELREGIIKGFDKQNAIRMMDRYLEKLDFDWNIFHQEIKKKELINSFTKIENLFSKLGEKEKASLREKVAWLRIILKTIWSELDIQQKYNHLNRDNIKHLKYDISELLKYTAIISLNKISDDIPEMLSQIENFKSVLNGDEILLTKREPINVVDILNEVIISLGEFAQSRGIKIKKNFKNVERFNTEGGSRELYNAFFNVLHNAIKYSHSGNQFDEIPVYIDLSEARGIINVKIINIGVPIRSSELTQKLIFKFGYRGAESMNEGRKGSGIGLWAANKIINQHGGNITVKSEPIIYSQTENYAHPFETTVTISIKTKVYGR